MCQISYSSQLAVILALNFNFLTVPGVVTPGSAASQIELIIYCSMISAIVSMAYFFGLINVYGDLRFRFASIVVCFHGRYNSCCSPWPWQAEGMWMLTETKLGTAGLAIVHSLPFASLIWSCAISSHCCMHSHLADMISESYFSPQLLQCRFSIRRNLPLSWPSALNVSLLCCSGPWVWGWCCCSVALGVAMFRESYFSNGAETTV